MSYIKIELGGVERGLKFNQLAIELIGQYYDQQTGASLTYSIFYGGLRGNSYVKREEPDYTFEDVCDWIDSLPMATKMKTIESVSNTLNETQLWRELIDAGTKAIEQKKSQPVKKTRKQTLKT